MSSSQWLLPALGSGCLYMSLLFITFVPGGWSGSFRTLLFHGKVYTFKIPGLSHGTSSASTNR